MRRFHQDRPSVQLPFRERSQLLDPSPVQPHNADHPTLNGLLNRHTYGPILFRSGSHVPGSINEPEREARGLSC
jgi:hypothetical protein